MAHVQRLCTLVSVTAAAVYYYKDMKVTFTDGRVSNVE
jgi:hypothetical protein